MDETTWVDFRAVKAAVSFEMVLGRYGVKALRKSGDNLVGRCPLHGGDGERSFSVNPAKRAFKCWSCKVHGNVLDFTAAMEKCTLREAALKLSDWFHLAAGVPPPAGEGAAKTPAPPSQPEAVAEQSRLENKPLGFALKDIDVCHDYVRQRGIEQRTAELFGVGFFPGKGSMSGRIVIPIHNAMGELVAYAGRAIDDSEPKYKLPAGFHKSVELYNFHRAVKVEAQGRVIVVEGFFDCMNVHQAGFPGVVAVMGCEITASQVALLADSFYEVIVLFDGDDAGRAGALHAAAAVSEHAWVRRIALPHGRQPDQCTTQELHALLDSV